MLKFFRTIRKKLIEQNNVRKYLLYAIGEILLVVIGKPCPVRDNIWVETMYSPHAHRAVRLRPPTGWYGICGNLDIDLDTAHIAYLRHAVLVGDSVFSTDMQSLRDRESIIESLNLKNLRFPC
jgi:hypothetical protein